MENKQPDDSILPRLEHVLFYDILTKSHLLMIGTPWSVFFCVRIVYTIWLTYNGSKLVRQCRNKGHQTLQMLIRAKIRPGRKLKKVIDKKGN